MHDDLTIPLFLRIPQEERDAAWKGRRLTRPKADTRVTRDEDASTKAFRRQMEKLEADKVKARLLALRERYKK